jgi:hypothetical protein
MRVTPIRFTNDVAGMRRFLEALGLQAHISSDSGVWLDLRGSGGGVQAHDAQRSEVPGRVSGETGLAFEADEPLEDVLARLLAAGFADAHIIDEQFGRSLRATDPDGLDVFVAEPMSDLYGYTRHGGE